MKTGTGSRTAAYRTPWGEAWVEFNVDGPIAMGLPGSEAPPGPSGEPPEEVARLVSALERYWAGGALPSVSEAMLDRAAATPLMRRIYEVVSAIPAGACLTYREVAAAAGRPAAARSVGAAMARNPFAPLIPCHRVVGSDGTLRGYGGGLAMKRGLLDMEAGRA